jgi:hypothetical protein
MPKSKARKEELKQYHCGIESKKPSNKIMGDYNICKEKNQIRHYGERTEKDFLDEYKNKLENVIIQQSLLLENKKKQIEMDKQELIQLASMKTPVKSSVKSKKPMPIFKVNKEAKLNRKKLRDKSLININYKIKMITDEIREIEELPRTNDKMDRLNRLQLGDLHEDLMIATRKRETILKKYKQ